MAPDGKSVRQVGFTIVREGKPRDVSLTISNTNSLLRRRTGAKRQPDMPLASSVQPEAETVRVAGILKMADDIKDEKEIQLLDGEIRHSILVPLGLMADIVRPLWDTYVAVTGVREGGKIRLLDIQPEVATPAENDPAMSWPQEPLF